MADVVNLGIIIFASVFVLGLCLGVLISGWWIAKQHQSPSNDSKVSDTDKTNTEQLQAIYQLVQRVSESLEQHQSQTDQVDRQIADLTTADSPAMKESLSESIGQLRQVNKMLAGELSAAGQQIEKVITEFQNDPNRLGIEQAEERLQTAIANERHRADANGSLQGGTSELASTAIMAADLRRHIRHSLCQKQRMAPYKGKDQKPDEQQFTEIEFLDISLSGVAFLTNIRPETDSIVLTLGDPQQKYYMVARIVHVAEAPDEGANILRVGCEFTEPLCTTTDQVPAFAGELPYDGL